MQEGELNFDFSSAKQVEKLDEKGKMLPEGMKFVDFVVEEERDLFLIEVKDPSCKAKGGDSKAEAAIQKQREEFIKKIYKDDWIAQDLTPKARDSYTFLHLMGRDTKPTVYVLLIGSDKLMLDPALLTAFKDRLLAKLCQEADQPWVRQYVADCLIVTENTWSIVFPNYPLVRLAS